MNDRVREFLLGRGVTRICHFTQSRSLPHILREGRLMSVGELRERGLPVNPTDGERLDGYEDRISVSIEYPNAWYLAVARRRELLFEDWVILLIDPSPLWTGDALFFPVNAARGHGAHGRPGIEGVEEMYALRPRGSNQNRQLLHLECCPTDDQAEALVAGSIPAGLIAAVVCPSADAACEEIARLRHVAADVRWNWRSSPEMFDARRLSGRIRSSERVAEESVTAERCVDQRSS